MDGGPVPGHSLFTGCIIEALTGGIAADASQGLVTGSEIGQYVQRRVSGYPGSAQTPDFGSLELDDRGELVFSVHPARGETHPPVPAPRPAPAGPAPVARPPVKRTSPLKPALIVAGLAAAALVILAMSLPNDPARTETSEATLAPAAPRSAGSVTVDAAVASASALTVPAAAAPAPQRTDLPAAPAAPSTGSASPKHRPSSVVRRREGDPHHPEPAASLAVAPAAPASASAREPMASSSAPASALLPAPPDPPANQVPSGCRKENFAAVYAAPAPTRDTVRAALRNLKLCRDAGLISSDEFDRYQAALVAKL
jgi:hypothetical protein